MSESAQSHNNDCKNLYHNEHLCYLMYTGVHLDDKAGYKRLVQDAHFRCQRCGRTTRAARNLCEPADL